MRANEPWSFHVGMIILIAAYCCGWLSIKTHLYRYQWMGVGRLLLVIGHFWLAFIFATTANSEFNYNEYLIWNLVAFLINVVYGGFVFYYQRPISLHPNLHSLWVEMFGPDHYNLQKIDFYMLCQERARIMSFQAGETYFREQDVPNKLSILVVGKMMLYKTDDWGRREVKQAVFYDDDPDKHQRDMIVGEVNQFEFIDSFEWLSNGLVNNVAQVTVMANTDCVVVSWDYDVLKEIFKQFPRLRSVIMGMVGKDVGIKMLHICGKTLAGHWEWSDMVRRNDKPWQCWRDAGIRAPKTKSTAETEIVPQNIALDMEEVIARLRIANARMLAIQPSPLENLTPSAGVSSNTEHGAKLLSFFRRVVPDLPQRDLHELIKWGKWREYRKQFSTFLRKGEVSYYLGVVLDGQLDVLDEDESNKNTFKISIKEYELVGSEEFGMGQNQRSNRTIRVASYGAVLFVWDVRDLNRLMMLTLASSLSSARFFVATSRSSCVIRRVLPTGFAVVWMRSAVMAMAVPVAQPCFRKATPLIWEVCVFPRTRAPVPAVLQIPGR